jgi:hypothetical protein
MLAVMHCDVYRNTLPASAKNSTNDQSAQDVVKTGLGAIADDD